ncbi:MAG TPA: ribonuclease R [Microscillaceae bacterium]|nr:ribonuclease R [Microscillaceae bacterium]
MKNKKNAPHNRSKTNNNPHLFENVSALLQQSTKAISIKQIFKKLNVHTQAQKVQVVQILEKLAEQKIISINKEGHFKSNLAPLEEIFLVGKVDFVNPRHAFIVVEDQEQDIWVDAENLGQALDGDTVKVRLLQHKKGKRKEGEVVEILERRRTSFVGRIDISERYAFVIADNKRMYFDIFVPKEQTKGAKNGEKVLVSIVQWHTPTSNPVGVITEVLGKAGENNTEMHAILAEYDLPLRFPEAVLQEAAQISDRISPEEIKRRRDFRNITTFTIDPYDAKDFDDALSIQRLENGLWEIGVHIADVTHYVHTQTQLEKEAAQRATSVYLVDRVVPMLPERLSNELCSLRPHEEKLTFSAVFTLDESAQVQQVWLGRTIIFSDRRFSYEEAQQIIESGQGDFAQELKTLNQLAHQLTQQRFQSGAINFDSPEIKFKLDEQGRPIELYVKERLDAHRLIEEFMLLANKAVAEFVFHKGKEGHSPTMVYRIHEKPNEEKLQTFAKFAKPFGYDIALQGKALSNSLNAMIGQTLKNPEQTFLQSLAIKAMAKAKYSTEPIGHFGLAFRHYTHFTSPIRRYPDMMVHRLLQHYLDQGPSADKALFEKLCNHATDMEKRAADAERASIKYKQMEYMQILMEVPDMKNKIFDGVITGVTEWGVYVEITESRCEGMVRMQDILDDFYDLDAENYRLVGRKSKKLIKFGDKVRIKVKDINLEKRMMDLIFAK